MRMKILLGKIVFGSLLVLSGLGMIIFLFDPSTRWITLKSKRACRCNTSNSGHIEFTFADSERSNLSDWKNDWKKVTENIYVYSAYWDDRSKPLESFVRVVALGPLDEQEQKDVCCVTYNQDFTNSTVLSTSYEIIKEHHSKTFTSMFFYCKWSSERPPPISVALRHLPTSLESETLLVHSRPAKNSKEIQDKLAVCVRPFFRPFNNTLALAEFVAVYDILGVNKFTFYNYEMATQTRTLISFLEKQGFQIELLPWSLPDLVIKKIWAYGQLASIQDCIYRNMFDYKYVALVDIDEFIFPRNYRTIQAMIMSLPNENWGSLVFLNRYFCIEENSTSQLSLTTLNSVKCLKQIWKANFRSKLIVQPTRIVTCGIHFVWEHSNNWKSFTVPLSDCSLHHYRYGICGKFSHTNVVVDKIALTFKDELLNSKVIKIWKKMFL